MNKTIKRKWVQAALAVMCVLGMTCGFTSCEEELDPWVPVELEADCSQEEALPYDGGTFTVNVNANTAWTVITPEWMTADKTSGTGQGTVNITVMENKDSKQRIGSVQIIAGGSEPQGNVIGKKTSVISISQATKADVIDPNSAVTINSVETDLVATFHSTGLTQFDNYQVTGVVTYNVDTQYSDDFIAAIFGDAVMEITFLTSEDQIISSTELNIHGPSAFYAGLHTREIDEYDHFIFYSNIPAKCMIKIYGYDKSGEVINFFSSDEYYSIRIHNPYL